jgi:hypothetical protein
MVGRRWRQLVEHVRELRVLWREQRAEERAQDPDTEQDEAQHERGGAEQHPHAFSPGDRRLVRLSRDGDGSGWVLDDGHSAVA